MKIPDIKIEKGVEYEAVNRHWAYTDHKIQSLRIAYDSSTIIDNMKSI
jgi:hypothetical protein